MDSGSIDRLDAAKVDDDFRIAVADALLDGFFELLNVGSFDTPLGLQDENGPIAPLYGFDCQVLFRDRWKSV